MDIYSDPGHAHLRAICEQTPGVEEFLKTAEFEDSADDFHERYFAWPEKRAYPVHSPEHALVSYLYAKNAEDAPPKIVMAAIEDALDCYGVDKTIASPAKLAAAEPEECLFPSEGLYPVRNAHEVKLAESALLRDVSRLTPEMRAEVFTKLSGLAELHGVNLQPASHRFAGQTYTDREKLASELHERASLVKNQRLAHAYIELAQSVKTASADLRSTELRVKLAEHIGSLDMKADLLKLYDSKLPDPLYLVFNTDKVASHDDLDLGGMICTKTALSQLPASFYGDVLGKDVLAHIAPGGHVDVDSLLDVVRTLPTDSARTLARAVKAAGVSCIMG